MEENTNIIPRDRDSIAPFEAAKLPLPPFGTAPREVHLRDYLYMLRKHRWLILTFLLAIVTFVTIASFKMKPVYVASVRVEIDRESSTFLPFQQTAYYDAYYDLEAYVETKAKVLQSETLALQTIKSLGLTEHPEFASEPGKGKPEVSNPAGQRPPQQRPAILGAFLSRLTVQRVANSRLLDVKFEAHDAQLAAQVVNAHVQNFIEQNYRSRYEAATQASTWLTEQLNELKIKVEKSEDARLNYERQNQIWSIDEKQNITTQKLSDLNKELTEAQADRMRKEAIYRSARTGNIDALPSVRDSMFLQELLRKRGELGAQFAEGLSQFGPNYPKVMRLQNQLKDLDELVAREKINIVNRIESEYRVAQQREALLSQALEKQKTESNHLAERLVQHNILKRESEANKQLYEGLLQKLKEAGLTAGLRSSNIRIVDPALVPSTPARPQKARNILLAILIGLAGGVGLAFLREYLDNTVKNPEDIEFLTQLPSLAVVPFFSAVNGRRAKPKLLTGSLSSGSDTRVELVSHNIPQSPVSEAFRALRTSVLLSQPGRPPQVILVTSALAQEGKTTVAANLAVTLAKLGDRTLLIDADLRKPGVSRALRLSDGKYAGLSSYLAGVSSLELVTIPHPVITNLAAIPTGPIPPNPADLLSSARLSEAIAALRMSYRFIVIDSPPIIAATDAVILSVVADGVLLVVRSGETPKQAIRRSRDLLAGVKCRLLGVVLNGVDMSASYYYYSVRYDPYSSGGEKSKVSRAGSNE